MNSFIFFNKLNLYTIAIMVIIINLHFVIAIDNVSFIIIMIIYFIIILKAIKYSIVNYNYSISDTHFIINNMDSFNLVKYLVNIILIN